MDNNNQNEKAGSSIKITSVEELITVARKWKDIEDRVQFIAIKISQMLNDNNIPISFAIQLERNQVAIIYENNKIIAFPVEILILVPDEAIVEELIKPWLKYTDIPEEVLNENTQQGEEEKQETKE